MAHGAAPRVWALLLLLTCNLASAATGASATPPPSRVDQAASLLSRYPPGRVPLDGAVLDAIDLLGREGSAGEGVVLRSLALDEPGPVGLAASEAAEVLAGRTARASRLAYAELLPSEAAIEAWVEGHSSALAQVQHGPIGRSERQVLGYAALVLAGASSPAADDPLDAAQAHERHNQPLAAVAEYAAAAALGEDAALSALAAYGIDAERLLLGMTSPAAADLGLATLHPAAIAALVDLGSVRTVAVLIERARSGEPTVRSAAVRTLGQLIAVRSLPPGATLAARQCIDAAASDSQPAVRRAAEAALAKRD